MTSVDSLLAAVEWRWHAVADLAGCQVRIVSDSLGRPAFFDRFADLRDPIAGETTDVELWFAARSPLAVGALIDGELRTRARSFAGGYYATDHFGEPARLAADGRRYVVVGGEPDTIGWSFLVKYVLLRWSIERQALFLKAGAVVVEDTGVVLIGRGRGGKTTLATALCDFGATFVANSHVVVDNGMLIGARTAIRVRSGDFETLVPPSACFSSIAAGPVAADVVCLVAHSGTQRLSIQPIGSAQMRDVANQFALGLNVYRLEEDLLDLLGGDYRAFAEVCASFDARLQTWIDNSVCLLVDADVRQAGVIETLAAEIQEARR